MLDMETTTTNTIEIDGCEFDLDSLEFQYRGAEPGSWELIDTYLVNVAPCADEDGEAREKGVSEVWHFEHSEETVVVDCLCGERHEVDADLFGVEA